MWRVKLPPSSRHHRHRPKLSKMVVERKRPLNAQPLHDDSASAVGKAPFLVRKPEKHLGCFHHVGIGNADDVAATLPRLVHPIPGAIRLTARSKQRKQLIVNVIARHHPLGIRPHEYIRGGMVRVARNAGRIASSRIHKDCHSATVDNAVVIAIRETILRRMIGEAFHPIEVIAPCFARLVVNFARRSNHGAFQLDNGRRSLSQLDRFEGAKCSGVEYYWNRVTHIASILCSWHECPVFSKPPYSAAAHGCYWVEPVVAGVGMGDSPVDSSVDPFAQRHAKISGQSQGVIFADGAPSCEDVA